MRHQRETPSRQPSGSCTLSRSRDGASARELGLLTPFLNMRVQLRGEQTAHTCDKAISRQLLTRIALLKGTDTHDKLR